MMIKGHGAGKIYGRESIRPYVEMWEQPLSRWLIAHLYHLWEQRTWKLLRKIEPLHETFFNRNDDEIFIPLTNRQDLRCADLHERGKKHLIMLHITEEQYNTITGKNNEVPT
jgi:hypothetical protein